MRRHFRKHNLPVENVRRYLDKYNFFIWEVVRARAAVSPKYPQTLHYTGDGVFMVSGRIISRRRQFLPEML